MQKMQLYDFVVQHIQDIITLCMLYKYTFKSYHDFFELNACLLIIFVMNDASCMHFDY